MNICSLLVKPRRPNVRVTLVIGVCHSCVSKSILDNYGDDLHNYFMFDDNS